MSKNLLSNLLNDENRQLGNNYNNPNYNSNNNINNSNNSNYNSNNNIDNSNNNIDNSNNNIDNFNNPNYNSNNPNYNSNNNIDKNRYKITSFNTEINEKYKNHINLQPTIKENLGIIFNDDTIAQQTSINFKNDKIPHDTSNLHTENLYIIISSEDRPWQYLNNNENLLNFKIDCGDISIINNNQALSASIKQSIENVVSIMVTSIIIPNRIMENTHRPTFYPYLQVHIKGIENTSFGTNKYIDNSLAIVTSKIPLPNTLDDVKYIELVNTNKQIKEYYTPKSKLNKLDISILRYDGEQLLDEYSLFRKDVLDVILIYYDTDTDKLYIRTNNFFSPDNFKTNDIIKFNSYQFRETELGFSECMLFNEFINRERGHIIISTKKTDDIEDNNVIYHNEIIINTPRFINVITGKKEFKPWFINLLNSTNIDSDLDDDNTGRIINSSLQIQVLLTVKILNTHKKIHLLK